MPEHERLVQLRVADADRGPPVQIAAADPDRGDPDQAGSGLGNGHGLVGQPEIAYRVQPRDPHEALTSRCGQPLASARSRTGSGGGSRSGDRIGSSGAVAATNRGIPRGVSCPRRPGRCSRGRLGHFRVNADARGMHRDGPAGLGGPVRKDARLRRLRLRRERQARRHSAVVLDRHASRACPVVAAASRARTSRAAGQNGPRHDARGGIVLTRPGG
jgi:hypothetical protein